MGDNKNGDYESNKIGKYTDIEEEEGRNSMED